jgi:hypothetical protein
MNQAKRFGAVLASTVAIVGGLAVVAAPAMANIACTPPVSVGGDSVLVCADAGTYDAHPGEAGFGVHAAASVQLTASGTTIICTGYWGAGVNVPAGPDVQIAQGATTPPC